MKVSLNWVKEFTDVKGSVDEVVLQIGEQLGGVDEVIDIGKKFQGIVIVKVVKCHKHPVADKLSVCMVDDGGKVGSVKRENGLVQIVCGAPNVREGMLAVWLPPGATVPSSVEKEPLVLESRAIRGQVSNGMMASSAELGLSDDHSGILEINSHDAKPGDDFAKTYKLDDYIIDIENKMFTHRPDLFGILGVAREIAGIQHRAFKSPDWYSLIAQRSAHSAKSKLDIKVEVEDYKLTPRLCIVGMTVNQNPHQVTWLQTYLMRVGIRPINTIVDITNYLMHLTAQPLHAYDYDKVLALSGGNAAEIIARPAKKGEKLKLLGGKEISLQGDEIAIATRKQVIGLAGVMGGAETEVDANTKNIILEVANFDMYSIRRTAMEHGLFTDAVTRFTKGQSPLQNDSVIAKAVAMVEQLAQGEQASKLFDIKAKLPEPNRVTVSADFVNERLGSKLSLKDMAKLLENVEFKIASVPANKKDLHVQAPFWRTDIEIPEDIVEEIGRLQGFDKLPIELPRRSITPAATDDMVNIKSRLRDLLSAAGANEILTYTFVHGDLLTNVGQNKDDAYQLSNALSPDLQFYRLSLIPSLLEKVHPNIKQGYSEFALFEMNPVHAKGFVDDEKLPVEDKRLAFVFAVNDKVATQNYCGAPYYQAKHYLTVLLSELGIGQLVFEPVSGHKPELAISKAAIAPFEAKRASIVKTTDGQFIGELGEFRSSVRKNLKLPAFIAGFELDLAQVAKLQAKTGQYTPIPRFPKVEQDITLKVASSISFAEIRDLLQDQLTSASETSLTLEPLSIYQDEADTKHHNLSFRLSIASYEKTLTTEEVSRLLDDAATATQEKFNAERV